MSWREVSRHCASIWNYESWGELNGSNRCLHFELLSSESFPEFIFWIVYESQMRCGKTMKFVCFCFFLCLFCRHRSDGRRWAWVCIRWSKPIRDRRDARSFSAAPYTIPRSKSWNNYKQIFGHYKYNVSISSYFVDVFSSWTKKAAVRNVFWLFFSAIR